MRKRISCRVIESIPLIHLDDGLRDADEPFAAEPTISHFGSLTHSEHLAVMRSYRGNSPSTQTLDLFA